MVNLLSIDWDYFLTATYDERLKYFPDASNEDIPPKIQELIWASKYARFGKLLTDIKINNLILIQDILASIPPYAIVGISESHKESYYLFNERLRYCGDEEVNLLLIDHHSDTRSYFKEVDEQSVDCGNWLAHFIREHQGSFRWLCNTDSSDTGFPKKLERITDIKDAHIKDTAWDAVHICRSDVWSPPHLDVDFKKIFKPFADNNGCNVEKVVWKSRNNKKFKAIIESYVKNEPLKSEFMR